MHLRQYHQDEKARDGKVCVATPSCQPVPFTLPHPTPPFMVIIHVQSSGKLTEYILGKLTGEEEEEEEDEEDMGGVHTKKEAKTTEEMTTEEKTTEEKTTDEKVVEEAEKGTEGVKVSYSMI